GLPDLLVEEVSRSAFFLYSQVLIGQRSGFPPTGGPFEVTFLDQKGLVDFLNGSFVFSDRSGDGFQAYRAAAEFLDNGGKNLIVHFIQSVFIHVQRFQRILRNGGIDLTGALNLREVTCAAQQGVDNARCSPAPPGNLISCFLGDGCFQDTCRTEHNGRKQFRVVILQPGVDPEPGPQGSGEHARPGGSANEGKGIQRDLYRAGIWTGFEHDVNLVVLHGGVQVLLYDRT